MMLARVIRLAWLSWGRSPAVGAAARRATAELIECLEPRELLSASPTRLSPASVLYHPAGGLTPASTSAPHGLSPQQVRHAYGVDAIKFGTVAGDGRGQTIA